MRIALLRTMVAATLSLLAAAQPGSTDFKAYMQKVLDAWCSLDIKQPAKYYAQEPGAVFFDVSPLKYSGWSEYADGFSKTSIPAVKSAHVTISPYFNARRLGDHMLVTFTAHFRMEEKSGKAQEFDIRSTDILELRGGQWVIIHEHVSAPMSGN